MSAYYLAVDIGASSGRHILSHMEGGKIVLEEVYRFENGMEKVDGHLCWNLPYLYQEIKEGMKVCAASGKIPKTMGIDTWAVDYVLLDAAGEPLGKSYAYRDGRTKGMDEEVYALIPEEQLYLRTGIQKQMFNTIYQLMAVKKQEPELMEKAVRMIMLPDYFHYLLTGNAISEYTNATSTQLVSPLTKQWDMDLIRLLGYKEELFAPLSMPGTLVGTLLPSVIEEVGFDCQVVLPATHDTASAVIAVPALTDDCLYISSGTWSLMGVENREVIATPESMRANFTNEGGYDYRFRFLKNIMGLWMVQSLKKEQDVASFSLLCDLAEEENAFPSRVDVNDDVFMAPESMTDAVRDMCRATGQPVPETVGQLAAVIYQSLADCYADTVKEIESMTGKRYSAINIVGGGANADYLNRLTAKATGRIVYAGPGEGTAIGNLAVQMIWDGVFTSLAEVRLAIYQSFEVKKYE